MINATARKTLGLSSDKEDEEIVKEIIKMLCEYELTIDRAFRILEDTRSMLPHVAKLVAIKKNI